MNNIYELLNNKIVNTKKLNEEIYKLNDNIYCKSILYSKRGNEFYDISFINNKEEYFIGRYIKDTEKVDIIFEKDKMLICNKKFIDYSMRIVKVLGVYNILDNMLYSCNEIEALNLFNPNLDSKYLKTPTNYIYRHDLEKIKRNDENYKKM